VASQVKVAAMRLCEHPEFVQALIQASEYFRSRNLAPALIEKDYYVTEALRIIARTAGSQVIFKGGTSLSKGWNLIQRFSEDIDLFLDPLAFAPPLGKRGIDRQLKILRDAVTAHPAFSFCPAESLTIGGFGRSDRFAYQRSVAGPSDVANRVLLESGTASGREPTAVIELRSLLTEFLQAAGLSMGAEDEAPFSLRLLHFRRTFVEKMFALHGKLELLKREGQSIGAYARHYYDLFQLSHQPQVLLMLQSEEYSAIKEDYDGISRKHFPKSYFYPEGMRFANSIAFFPPDELSAELGAAYERQCKILCYGPYPSWQQVRSRFEEIKSLL
jgi:hypothetical protein